MLIPDMLREPAAILFIFLRMIKNEGEMGRKINFIYQNLMLVRGDRCRA